MAKKKIIKYTNVTLAKAGKKGILGGRGGRNYRNWANRVYRTLCRFFLPNYLAADRVHEKRDVTRLILLILELEGFYFVDFLPLDKSANVQVCEDEEHDTASDDDNEDRDQQEQEQTEGSFCVVTKEEADRRVGQYLRDGRTKPQHNAPHVEHPPFYETLRFIGQAEPPLLDRRTTELAGRKYKEYVENHPNLQQHRASTPALAAGDDRKPIVFVTPKSKTPAPEPFQFLAARRPSPPPATMVAYPLPAIVTPGLTPVSPSSTSSATLARRAPTPEEIENVHINMELFEAIQRVSLFEALEESTAARQWTVALQPRESLDSKDDMKLDPDSLASPRNYDSSNIEPSDISYVEPIKVAGADNQFALDDEMGPLSTNASSDNVIFPGSGFVDQASTNEVTYTGSCKNLDPIVEKIDLGEDFGGHHIFEIVEFPQVDVRHLDLASSAAAPNVRAHLGALDAMELSQDLLAFK